MTQVELDGLEADVADALVSADRSRLNIIGYGEISVALGYPADAPRVVCKRLAPATPGQFAYYSDLIDQYIADLTNVGIGVAPTTPMLVERERRGVAYLVQPLLDSSTLGHKVLASAEPDAEHPFVLALAQTVMHATNRLSIDAQVTNWSWSDGALTLVDVGTPFMWDADGKLLLDMAPFATMLPAPLRPLVIKDLTKVITRWQTPQGVGHDIVANLYREGLPEWIAPVVAALNRAADPSDPLHQVDPEIAHGLYLEDAKTFPRMKKLQQIERAWRTRVRRQPYDFFVQETTYS